MKKFYLFVVLMGLALYAVSCSQQPVEHVTAARQALDRARSLEAETYAEAELQHASETLSSALAEISAQDQAWFFRRNYGKAAELLTQAEQAAEAAQEAARVNKEQARAEVEAALSQAEEALVAAEAALQQAPIGKGTQADIDALKADLAAARTSFAEARQSFEASKYLEARTQLNAVITKAGTISSDVKQAVAKRRGTRRS